MAQLIKCPTCKGSISSKSEKCIHCGHISTGKTTSSSCLTSFIILAGAAVFLSIAVMFMGGGASSNSQETPDRKKSPNLRTEYLDKSVEPTVLTRKQIAVAAISVLNLKKTSNLNIKKHSVEGGFEIFNVFYTRDDGKMFSFLVSSLGNEISYMDANGPNRWNKNIRLYWFEDVNGKSITIKTVLFDGSSDSKSVLFSDLNRFH